MGVSIPDLRLPEAASVKVEIQITAMMNVTAPVAQQRVNRYLTLEVGNLLYAGDPQLVIADRLTWQIPILLGVARRGSLGKVGDISVDAQTGEILTDTMAPVEVIEAGAERLLASAPP